VRCANTYSLSAVESGPVPEVAPEESVNLAVRFTRAHTCTCTYLRTCNPPPAPPPAPPRAFRIGFKVSREMFGLRASGLFCFPGEDVAAAATESNDVSARLGSANLFENRVARKRRRVEKSVD